MSRTRDDLAVFNERVKLLANLLHATALGLIGFSVLRPVVEDAAGLTLTTLWWGIGGLAFHGAAHYMLGRLRKEMPDDSL